MKNKKRYILSKETTKAELQKIKEECKKNDMEIVREKSYNVQYDIKSCVTYPIDGSFVKYDKEEGRILFVQSYPHFNDDLTEDGKENIRGKIVCEIRMPASLFRILSNSIIDEITDYEKHEKKKAPLVEFLKNKNDQMFG